MDLQSIIRFCSLSALGALTILGSGCASPAPKVSLKQPLAGRTVLAMGIEITGTNSSLFDDGCQMIFEPVERGSSLHTEVSSKKRSLVIEAKEGRYYVSQIICGPSRKWEFRTMNPIFSVAAGKVNYSGVLKLQTNGALSLGGGFSSDRALVQETLSALLAKASPDIEKELVAASTGKKIDSSMLKSAPLGSLRWTTKGEFSDTALINPLENCLAKEVETNAVLLGSARWTAKYAKGGKLSDLKLEETSTYSDAFLNCVKTTLGNFNTGAKSPTEFELRF